MSEFATNWKIGFSIICFKKMKWLSKYFVVEAWKGMEFSVRLKNILAGGGKGPVFKALSTAAAFSLWKVAFGRKRDEIPLETVCVVILPCIITKFSSVEDYGLR